MVCRAAGVPPERLARLFLEGTTMADDTSNDDGSLLAIKVSPRVEKAAWRVESKYGIFAVLFLIVGALFVGLGYYVLPPRARASNDDVMTAVRENTALMESVKQDTVELKLAIAEAARMMHDASVARAENERVLINVGVQNCYLLADGPAARDSCAGVMMGQKPRALR